jgi:cytochrome b subunit of formate dehydrogenase
MFVKKEFRLLQLKENLIRKPNYSPIIHFFIILVVSVILPWIVSAQTVDDCLACHSDSTLTMEKNGKTILLFADHAILKKSPHAKLVCIACHSGFDAGNLPHKEKIDPVNCLNCHKDATTRHLIHSPILKSKTNDLELVASCKQCHGTHNVQRLKVGTTRMISTESIDICATCHEEQARPYRLSAHGKASDAGVIGAPVCMSCHRSQISGLKGSSDSAKVKLTQEKLCLSCHLDDPHVRAQVSPTAGFIAAYEKSVHGSALLKGNAAVANCIDCHGSHEIKKGKESTSRVNRERIPETCGTCHASIAYEYRESIHGTASSKGNKEAPVCTDCHGEHNILSPSNPNSRVSPRNVSAQVCAPCHSSVTLTEKYGLAGDRFKTFSSSFHGLATSSGSIEVANCASCHGVHNIKPSSDSTSLVHKSNLATTCGKCHPGANERFTVGSIHSSNTNKSEEPVLYWVSFAYILLIASTIGGMVLHNLLDFYRRSKRRLMIRRGLVHEEHYGHTLYVRMTLNERIQHISLMISFFTLVLTGFMLRYPESFWVVAIRNLNTNVFDMRGILHRISAAVMVTASLYHLYYIFFVPRGKQLIRDLLPTMNDINDAIAVLKYNLGFSTVKPQFDRFSYIEKSEYWALVWGTVVMSVTGVILWFDNTFMGLFTKLGWDVARAVHFYEAWLAFLAILIWHIYFVIFNPDIYPMNLAWLKGSLTESEMAEEHPKELAAIKRKELAEDGKIISVIVNEENASSMSEKTSI